MRDTDRREAVALNESAFREINDRVRDDLAQLQVQPDRIRFVCECGQLSCREQVELTGEQYERLRTDPMRFVVRIGHEILDTEDVVERGEGFNVVRKHDDVADVVQGTHPRR